VAVLRLFIALYPPLEVARELLAALAALELPAHRATLPEQLHMTVLFLGATPERELDAVLESIDRAAAGVGSFTLTPRSLARLPERGPARLVAALTDSPPALLELRRRLVARLASARRKPGPLTPHFTLCRFRAPTSCELGAVPLHAAPFEVASLSLRSSVLRPEGAEHRQIAGVNLGAN
jgi:2'-5' RNA ligase